MNYTNQPNLLLEALAFLGRRATGNTWADLESKIIKRHLIPDQIFNDTLKELKKHTLEIDHLLSITSETAENLFGNMEGLSKNTIGSASRSFLLYYPWIYLYQGDLQAINQLIISATPEEIAYNIASSLDLNDDITLAGTIEIQRFMGLVLEQTYPEHTKLLLLELLHSYKEIVSQASPFIETILGYLESQKEQLQTLIQPFHDYFCNNDIETAFHGICTLTPNPTTQYEIRPFIFGMDTNITFNYTNEHIGVCCGILRKNMLDMLHQYDTSSNSVFEAYKLLGDRTRYDILCFLKHKSAYGQELSAQFNLSRNTIHHHMNKLIAAGLVSCTIDGNRVYYSVNKDTITELIEKQKELFI